MRTSVLAVAILTALVLEAQTALANSPEVGGTSKFVEAAADNGGDLRPKKDPTPVTPAPDYDPADAADSIARQPTVVNAPAKVDIDIRTEACTNMGDPICSNTRTACMVDSGNANYFEPPTKVYSSTNNGPWVYIDIYCGTPESITLPDEDGSPVQVTVEPPPVPTFEQIQRAYKRLPFSKPTASIQPVGLKTLVNLPTSYQASWPDDTGLQPGEISDPVQLLSWTVEFKITAKEYRYNYGDDTTSDWTTSTGGTYPDGDITHTYDTTGTVPVSIDARLTGQYRVNGGPWQDIATTADLQDEPTSDLQVLGTDTKLVAE